MVLPLLPLLLIGGGAVSGAGGVAAGIFGGLKMKDARVVAEDSRLRYEAALALTQAAVNTTNGRVRRYGQQQGHARRYVVLRMADFIRRHQRQVSQHAAHLLDGLEVDI